MYGLGVRRSTTFSPRASRSRSRWRIFSRSTATDFMRLDSASVTSSGMASVITVATAPMAANTIARKRGSLSFWIRRSIMARTSEVEVDHLAHDEDADRHPDGATEQHRAAHGLGP